MYKKIQRIFSKKNKSEDIIIDSIKNAKVILFSCDSKGKILLQQGAGLKEHGLVENQYVGYNAFEVFNEIPGFLDALKLALSGKPSQAVYKWGNTYCETHLNPTENGDVVGVCTTQTDRIFREKETNEKETEQTKRSTQEDILAIFSHEIRNPLSNIIGVINLLKLESDNTEYLDVLYETSNEMLNMLNNLLDNSKLKKGYMKVDISSFNINSPIRDVVNLFKFNTKNIKVVYTKNDYSSVYCLGDVLKIKQILINFVNNALKFSPENTLITLSLNIHDKIAKFSVTDQGCGISKDNISKLFQEYTQLSGAFGTGLGLSICKKMIHLLKGEIGCDSYIGVGSTFWFTLPLELSISNFEKNILGSWVIPDY